MDEREVFWAAYFIHLKAFADANFRGRPRSYDEMSYESATAARASVNTWYESKFGAIAEARAAEIDDGEGDDPSAF